MDTIENATQEQPQGVRSSASELWAQVQAAEDAVADMRKEAKEKELGIAKMLHPLVNAVGSGQTTGDLALDLAIIASCLGHLSMDLDTIRRMQIRYRDIIDDLVKHEGEWVQVHLESRISGGHDAPVSRSEEVFWTGIICAGNLGSVTGGTDPGRLGWTLPTTRHLRKVQGNEPEVSDGPMLLPWSLVNDSRASIAIGNDAVAAWYRRRVYGVTRMTMLQKFVGTPMDTPERSAAKKSLVRAMNVTKRQLADQFDILVDIRLSVSEGMYYEYGKKDGQWHRCQSAQDVENLQKPVLAEIQQLEARLEDIKKSLDRLGFDPETL